MINDSELIVAELLSRNPEYPELTRTKKHRSSNRYYITVNGYNTARGKEIVTGLKSFLKKKGRHIRVKGRHSNADINKRYPYGDIPLNMAERVDIYVRSK